MTIEDELRSNCQPSSLFDRFHRYDDIDDDGGGDVSLGISHRPLDSRQPVAR